MGVRDVPDVNAPVYYFHFKVGTVEVTYERCANASEGCVNIPKAKHGCRSNPWSAEWRDMNVRFNNNRAGIDDVLDAALFCPYCGLRVAFRWSQDMPLHELNRQFRLAADCSHAGSDSFAPGSDMPGLIG